MSKFTENNPSAIEVLLFYEKEKKAKGEKLSNETWDLIGEDDELTIIFDKMTMKDDESKRKEIRKLVVKNQVNLRLCILSDVINKKSITESVLSIIKVIGTQDIDCQDFEFWFGRFSSGNRNLDQKTFSDMPIEVVGNIVEQLDFPSQMRLRNMSNGLRNIVDESRLSIDQIYLDVIECLCPEYHLELSIHKSEGPESDKKWEYAYRGEDNVKKALDGMKTFLNNRRLWLEIFSWNNRVSTEIDYKFIDVINSLNNKLETESLLANLDGDLMIDLLKAIKPGTLEYLDFGGKLESVHIDRLAQLDQWKKAKNVTFVKLFLLFTQNDELYSFDIETSTKPSDLEIGEALGLPDESFDKNYYYYFKTPEMTEADENMGVCITKWGIEFRRETEEDD
uniref:F-box domain-containing protein n=1 Tax=Caenorhabditis tropicalis TaxID=1561998 RepID=A0A1I7U4G0_9PELO